MKTKYPALYAFYVFVLIFTFAFTPLLSKLTVVYATDEETFISQTEETVVEETVVVTPEPVVEAPVVIEEPAPVVETTEPVVTEPVVETAPVVTETPAETEVIEETQAPVEYPVDETVIEEVEAPVTTQSTNKLTQAAEKITTQAKPVTPTFTFEALYNDGDPFQDSGWTTGNPCSGQHTCYQEEQEMALRITISDLPRLDDDNNVITYTLGLQHEYYRTVTDVYGYLSYYQEPLQGLILPNDSNTSDSLMTYLGESSCPGNVICRDYEMTFTVNADGEVVLYFMVSISDEASEWGNGNNDASLQATLNGFTPGNGNGGSHTIPNQIEPDAEIAYLTICKDVIGVDEEDITDDDTLFDVELSDDSGVIFEGQISDTDDGCVTTEVEAGVEYTVEEENVPVGYTNLGCIESPITLEEDEEATVICTNQIVNLDEVAIITVVKDVIDAEGNDVLIDEDTTEFDINLNLEDSVSDTGTISDTTNGEEVFTVDPGTYSVDELLTAEQSEVYEDLGCFYDGVVDEVEVIAGDEITFVCTNQLLEVEESPLLTITKSNNAPAPLFAGDTVIYTINVTATGDVDEVYVNDVSPEGFDYISGSWTASTSVPAKVLPTTEPTYHSPGTWYLGDLVDGEVITLTYAAFIATSTQDGVYPDLAYTFGLDIDNQAEVLGLSEADLNSHFAKTDVEIISLASTSGVILTSTVLLPNTGISTAWTVIAITTLVLGASLIIASKLLESKTALKKVANAFNFLKSPKLKFVLFMMVFTMGFFSLTTTSVKAAPAKLEVSIEQPASPTNETTLFINYVVLDIDNSTVDINCQIDNGSGFTTFESLTTPAGGNNGTCDVASNLIASDGTYKFQVIANGVESNEVSVVVDRTAPATPSGFSKVENACSYTVNFVMPSDASYVELYRSEDLTFNSNEKVATITNNGVTNISYADNLAASNCGKTMYYILRSVDNTGNASVFAGDTQIVENILIPAPTPTPAANNAGNQNNADSGQVLGEQTTDEDNVTEDSDDEGNVLGEDDSNETTSNNSSNDDESKDESKDSNYVLIGAGTLAAIVAAGTAAYFVMKKNAASK